MTLNLKRAIVSSFVEGCRRRCISYLRPDTQFELITRIFDRDISELVARLYIDDLADFLEEMPASVAKRVLDNTAPDKRSNVNRILKYPEDSAGSIMTTEYMHLKQDMTVADAIDRLRA